MLADKLIRILVVEDHHVVRKSLVTLLETVAGFEVVGEAGDGVEAINQFHLCQPDVTLIDLRLPGISGAEVVRSIRSEAKHARFIVLTTYDGEDDVYRALRSGAQSYLLKGITRDELIAAIHLVNEGRSHVPPEIFAKLARRLEWEEFTPRESEVLEHIVQGRSNKQIAQSLGVSEATIKAHINSLLSKLGVSDRTQAAMTAIQRGLVTLDFS
ncbi:response regulator [Occallatibacter riparius]|uniref:Response regulator transcription factor n=1 Tax=Occallatibacter riparius TaxID=1002689 RepID=A0A9J7BK11_9BACT|nr:response regulator transcription factor [Occallatibacter riparius]UWZ82793.1 response regulator transcription factor [Occallatibacter riparius]